MGSNVMSYKYINPTEKGFVYVKVSRRQHNKMVPNRKQRLGAKVEYYFHPESLKFEAHYFCSLWMKVAIIAIMFMPAILMQGFPETIKDTMDLIHERKRGKFSCDEWRLTDSSDPIYCYVRKKIM